LDESSQSSKVGSASRVGLDVNTPLLRVQAKGSQGTLAAKVLELIDMLVTSVVTGTGKTFRVLVGQSSTIGLNGSLRSEVLKEKGIRLSFILFS
jgi:hypothetical protein